MAAKRKTSDSKEMVNWEEELAKDAAADGAVTRTSGGGSFFSIRGGVLSYKGEPIQGNTTDVVILDFLYENAYYGGEEFDPDNLKTPVCFAMNRDPKLLTPDPESQDIQNETCEGCWADEWGTGKGKGKACKNGAKLAVIPASDLDAVAADSEIGFIRIPPSSLKYFDSLKTHLTEVQNIPTYAALVNITVEREGKLQFPVVRFNFLAKAQPKYFSILRQLRTSCQDGLQMPYSSEQAALPAPGKKGKKATARLPAKKKAAPKKKRAGKF